MLTTERGNVGMGDSPEILKAEDEKQKGFRPKGRNHAGHSLHSHARLKPSPAPFPFQTALLTRTMQPLSRPTCRPLLIYITLDLLLVLTKIQFQLGGCDLIIIMTEEPSMFSLES